MSYAPAHGRPVHPPPMSSGPRAGQELKGPRGLTYVLAHPLHEENDANFSTVWKAAVRGNGKVRLVCRSSSMYALLGVLPLVEPLLP